MAIINIQDQTFQETLDKEKVVLVDFWAPWCGPCKMIAPVLEELDKEIGSSVTIAKMNVDDNPFTPGKLGIMGIPTLKLYKNGEEVASITGYQPLPALKEIIGQHLN